MDKFYRRIRSNINTVLSRYNYVKIIFRNTGENYEERY